MTKLIYYFALAVASITFVINVFSDNGIFNGFVRSAIVFLGILFIMSVAAHIMKGIMQLNDNESDKVKKGKTENKTEEQEEMESEEKESSGEIPEEEMEGDEQ